MASMVVGTDGSGSSWALSASAAAAPAISLGDPALDAAVRYFGAHGLRSTALDDLARAGDLDVGEVSRRYPTSRRLALGVFERMLDLLVEQLEEQSKRGAPLSERLQSWFELELRLLEPCKALVRSWLIDGVNPLSPAALLQGPLAFRYATEIQRELELARSRGEISGWIVPVVAAGAFIGLRRSLVLGWLGDASPSAARTLPLARAEIAAFVRLLAPWPGLDDVRPSRGPSSRIPESRALGTPAQATPSARLLKASAAVAVEAAAAQAVAEPIAADPIAAEPIAVVPAIVVQTEAAPAAAVNAAMAQAPAVLGTLAQPADAPEPLVSPAPVQPGSEKSGSRSQRRARAKRSKH